MLIAGCGSHDDGDTISVLSAKAGDCFSAPTKVKAEVSDLDLVPCSSPHSQEAYALVNYARADDAGDGAGDDDDTYPGDQVLDEYAAGVCAQRFGVYVGVDYLDSSYYYTYLTPSPRSWQAKDRAVLCLITDAGKPMVGSVKGKGA